MTNGIRTILAFDEERAEVVFGPLHRLWLERNQCGTDGWKVFGGIVLPQDMHPRPEDSVEHARWLTNGLPSCRLPKATKRRRND